MEEAHSFSAVVFFVSQETDSFFAVVFFSSLETDSFATVVFFWSQEAYSFSAVVFFGTRKTYSCTAVIFFRSRETNSFFAVVFFGSLKAYSLSAVVIFGFRPPPYYHCWYTWIQGYFLYRSNIGPHFLCRSDIVPDNTLQLCEPVHCTVLWAVKAHHRRMLIKLLRVHKCAIMIEYLRIICLQTNRWLTLAL